MPMRKMYLPACGTLMLSAFPWFQIPLSMTWPRTLLSA